MSTKLSYGDNGDPDLIKRNPITPCPGSPNCVRVSFAYDIDSKQLFETVLMVLNEMGAVDIEPDHDKKFVSCVFNIFIFKDDVAVQCETEKSGAVLHAKSNSRVGYGDLGVNKRRMKEFLQKLDSIITK